MASCSNELKYNKQIYDPIHGFIEITPLMQIIIDTPEFQRLRDLKQLGAVHYIYPSATHTRFEHSLGVSHLAGIMSERLFGDGIMPNTNKKIVELTRIAGLIHDIGHGPYSHLYDSQVRYHNEPEHEERGCNIFKTMVNKYKIPLSEKEIVVITDMVNPPPNKIHDPIYQIVANKVNQIDVDKIDYIQRDSYHIGLKIGGEWSRLLNMCKISNIKTSEFKLNSKKPETVIKQITWPKKLEYEILQLFSTRYRLHRQVYNHHTVKAYAILKNAKYKRINFLDLTDSVVTCRLHDEWRDIQDKIASRQIPKLIEEKIIPMEEYYRLKTEPYPRIIVNTIIDVIKIGFASSERSPLENVWLHDMSIPNKVYKLDKNMSIDMPQYHQEAIMRKYKL